MDALGAVDDLGDSEIDTDARQGERALELQALEFEQIAVGLADRHLHRLVEHRVEAEGHPMTRTFGARRGQLHALVQDELQDRGVGGLHRRYGDFTVALGGMRIAGVEQTARMEHRQEQRGAADQFLAVEIAAEHAGRAAATVRAILGGWQHAHHAHERAERNLDARLVDADLARQIELDGV